MKSFPNNTPNGQVLNISVNNSLIGQPDQKENPYVSFSMGEKMRRSGTKDQTQVFDNNGSSNKGSAGGVINNNGEYGPITYGF